MSKDLMLSAPDIRGYIRLVEDSLDEGKPLETTLLEHIKVLALLSVAENLADGDKA
jgi:hypothetical protein